MGAQHRGARSPRPRVTTGPRALLWMGVVAALAQAACLITIDDGKLREAGDEAAIDATQDAAGDAGLSEAASDATARDDGDTSSVPCWDGSLPPSIVFSGYSVSTSEIELQFTPGLFYNLARVSHGDPDAGTSTLGPISPCTSTYSDHGQVPGIGVWEDGGSTGLTKSYQYTYLLTPLDSNGEAVGAQLALVVETWWNETTPPPAGSDGDASVQEALDASDN